MNAKDRQVQYYVWSLPQKQISIHLSLDVVDRINLELRKGFVPRGRPEMESGGLLLGRRMAEPGRRRIVIVEECQPVASSDPQSPYYKLAGETLDAISEERESRLKVVGYYRSHVRKGLFLSHEDATLCASHFSHPADVVLIVKPFVTRSSLAGFFFWEDGAIRGESSYLDFHFDRRTLVDAKAESPKIIAENRPEAGPNIVSAPRTHSQISWLPWVLATALGTAGLWFGLPLQQRTKPAPSPSLLTVEAGLGLRVNDNGRELQVSWDRNTPEVTAEGNRGVLTITDGDFTKQVVFEDEQLRSTSLVYEPITSAAQFHLEVFGGGRSAAAHAQAPRKQSPATSIEKP